MAEPGAAGPGAAGPGATEPGGTAPGAAGWQDTLDDEYDTNNIRLDVNIIQPIFETTSHDLPDNTKYNASPQLPFKNHEYPSLINLSNKFREKGPNKIMYPPKNGPIALMKKYGGSPLNDLPPYDPFDELTFDIEEQIKEKYSAELRSLYAMQFTNELQNIRALNRNGSLLAAQEEISLVTGNNNKYHGIFIGDTVVRGPDWKWGHQDGAEGLKGTVRGLRQWHPADICNAITEVVVLWHHGLYGNYRYNYRGAYDVRVINRLNLKSIQMEPICVGDTVCRKQANWRWANQDGGKLNNDTQSYGGTIIELYASPAPFEGGARIAVCWDNKKDEWQEKANQYKQRKENKQAIDLSLDQFEYNIEEKVDDAYAAFDAFEDDDDDEKKEEPPAIIANSNEELISPSSTGKGACMVTSGVKTDDPWSMRDDYKEWDSENTAEWVRELNDDFNDYGDVIQQNNITGQHFQEFELMSFWMDKVYVTNEAHAKALAAAAKYRMEQYQIQKYRMEQNIESENPVALNNNNNKNIHNNNNNQNFEEEPPPKPFEEEPPPKPFDFGAFGMFEIPMMDESLLQNNNNPHLQVPENEGEGMQLLTDDDEPQPQQQQEEEEEEEDKEEDDIAAAAAPAAPAAPGAPGAFEIQVNNNQPAIAKPLSLPPATPPDEDINNINPGGQQRKKLYFWQKVVKKEAELMKIFSESRPLSEYVHITHGQYGKCKQEKNDDNKMNENDFESDDEYEWKEPDFDELLSKPIPIYRWGIQYNYDLQIEDAKAYTSNREYLMIDDRVKRGKDFSVDEKVGDYKSDFGIVLKIEQWDDTRLEKHNVRGDKIYLTWSSHRPFRFNYNGKYDIEFFKRGQVFASDYSHIRVGDTVCRGFSWSDDMYGDEDGGQGQQGIVTTVQYVLQVTGIIAKVRWHKNNHINLYSWGFKKVYDIRRVSQ